MAKRRTRKQKMQARHEYTISWEPKSVKSKFEPKNDTSEPNVKRQSSKQTKSKRTEVSKSIHPEESGKLSSLASIKKDIIKSLILAGLILASEIVIYLIWY